MKKILIAGLIVLVVGLLAAGLAVPALADTPNGGNVTGYSGEHCGYMMGSGSGGMMSGGMMGGGMMGAW